MVLNKAKLGIQADIFVDVTCSVVRLRAKGRANLEDTLKDTHHSLLVKLRALRQERWPSKVVQLENVRAALSSCRHDLWRLDLGKSALNQCTAKTSHHPGSQPQHGSSCRVTIRHNGMVEQSSNARRNFSLVGRHRRHLRHRRDHLDARLVQ